MSTLRMGRDSSPLQADAPDIVSGMGEDRHAYSITNYVPRLSHSLATRFANTVSALASPPARFTNVAHVFGCVSATNPDNVPTSNPSTGSNVDGSPLT